MRLLHTILIIASFSLFSEFSYSDVLIIDRINAAQDFAIPKRGITMNQVTSQFGEPKIKHPTVGEPPITKWQYEKFSVYFEGKWVINTVVHKATPHEEGPKHIK